MNTEMLLRAEDLCSLSDKVLIEQHISRTSGIAGGPAFMYDVNSALEIDLFLILCYAIKNMLTFRREEKI